MPKFTPPPTHSDPVVVDPLTGKSSFNPLWLKWFLDVSAIFSAVGATSEGISHEVLADLLGGAAGQHFHISAQTHGDLLAGISTTITTAKLTPGGANGSMTFVRGILTSETPAT